MIIGFMILVFSPTAVIAELEYEKDDTYSYSLDNGVDDPSAMTLTIDKISEDI